MQEILGRKVPKCLVFVDIGANVYESITISLVGVAHLVDAFQREPASLAMKVGFTARILGKRECVEVQDGNSVIPSVGIPESPDLLSRETVGKVYRVRSDMEVIRQRVLVVEYNGRPSSGIEVPHPSTRVMPPDRPSVFGASLTSCRGLGQTKRHRLIYSDSKCTDVIVTDKGCLDPKVHFLVEIEVIMRAPNCYRYLLWDSAPGGCSEGVHVECLSVGTHS